MWKEPEEIRAVTEQRVQQWDLSAEGKETFKPILQQAEVAPFQNDSRDLGEKYVHIIEGGVHPAVRQYPLNPEEVEEMDVIVGWRPVINFNALNR